MTHPQKRTVMEWLRDIFPGTFGKPAPPVIMTQWGPVTESYRLQAATNMRLNPDLRERVEAIVIRECGGDRESGLKEAQRRYPEAYIDE